MNAVNTGWVADEDPATLAKIKEDATIFSPPWILWTVPSVSATPFSMAFSQGNTGVVNF